MDLLDILLRAGLATAALVAYLILSRKSSPQKFKGHYRQPAWNYLFRLITARFAVKKWKSQLPSTTITEGPRVGQIEGWDAVTVKAAAPDGSAVLLGIRQVHGRQNLAEVTVFVKLPDGTTYTLPQHPDTAVGPYEWSESGWSAGGLKIQVLEEQANLRVLFNGLLKRNSDNQTLHCRFNFIWASASPVVKFPEDWDNGLAARALALEPWRDDKWPFTLSYWGGGDWLQWGTVQGRFTSYDSEGSTDQSVYLRLRGVRDRSWSPQGYKGLRRSVVITATASDGTHVQLRGFSYNKILTIGFCGNVRYPDHTVESVSGTDMVFSEFCENPDVIPSVHITNVSTKRGNINVILRIGTEGGKLLSGIPYQFETVYRTAVVSLNGEFGTAIIEFSYEATAKGSPTVDLSPRRLKWLSEKEAGTVGYCLPFEAKAAACTNYVGGKGASLALLASVQEEQGYKVPPGFCLTTKAMEKHLQYNSDILTAIEAIAAANENYIENKFKDKCNKAVELFNSTDIVEEVKAEILFHIAELRKKAIEQNSGPQLRFAVRSSAVGEDSEALSAAGQNDTVLGCVSDDDILKGVQKCWASMFAFTSANYRRQNGQACLCGGGVVVQTLVVPRAAGVLFTRHPADGDPSRLLLTANYGLGETVVSGSVEPDTFIVKRVGEVLTVAKIDLGSKLSRVTASGDGVRTEEVPENERRLPCLTVSQVLQLARIGVAQDKLWNSGRDIEWAITKDAIFLLQARPITSLERWTEEELIHELDYPVMSDDELLTFANTGEVMPLPGTAITYDLVYKILCKGISTLLYKPTEYDRPLALTHNRAMLPLYTTVYRSVPKKLDLSIRIIELALHGRKVADEQILRIAQHRRPTNRISSLMFTVNSMKTLFLTKSCMKDQIKRVKKLSYEKDTENPLEILDVFSENAKEMIQCSRNHAVTSSGNTTAQFIAMMVLTEGAADCTQEQCNEMNLLLSSGDVLSAEVPHGLAKLTKMIEDSDQAEEFRKQNPKEAMDWLKVNLPMVYEGVSKFLEEHGHRAVMEFDLLTKPWALVPEELMQILQNMRLSNQAQSSKSKSDIVASLKTPKKSSTRTILRWLIPLCRVTVRHREITKGYLILAIHKARLALRRLGRLLVRQWYLPDEDLVFFFRLHELKEFVLTRDPVLLRRAIQRHQIFPKMCKLKFAEMNTGWVEPLQNKGPIVTAGDFRLKATSVCNGEVIARACIVKELSEIGQLQRGDVLITHSTDIGWSPYFPLLAGIVTELGGLISHGAVIAREYGLPCIVGAEGATDMFRTGDMVRLSGNDGFVEKVQLEERTDKQEQES